VLLGFSVRALRQTVSRGSQGAAEGWSVARVPWSQGKLSQGCGVCGHVMEQLSENARCSLQLAKGAIL